MTGLWKQLEIMIEIIVEIDKEGIMMNIQELEKRIKLPEAAGKAVDQIKITEAEYQEQKQILIEIWKNLLINGRIGRTNMNGH